MIVRATLVENGLDGLMREQMGCEAYIMQNIDNRMASAGHIEARECVDRFSDC